MQLLFLIRAECVSLILLKNMGFGG